MADFHRIWSLRQDICDELDSALAAKNENEEGENFASVRIQRLFRGMRARTIIAHKRVGAGGMQRIFRGYMGRKRARGMSAAKKRDIRLGFFHYQASIVQKFFRGYYSRKYSFNFFARKAYILNVIEKSEELRQQLHEHRQRQLVENERRREEEARVEFAQVTENLHHLLSTKAQPGIYNSPYLQGDVPTAFNVPVEDHLREGMDNYLNRSRSSRAARTNSRTASSRMGTASTFGSSSMRPRSRLSVQAESKYGAAEEARKNEEKYSRLRRLSSKPFSAGTKVRMTSPGPGISQGTPYEELWKIARSSRDPAEEDKTKRVSEAPFVTAMKKKGRAFDDYADEKYADMSEGGDSGPL